MKCSFTIAKVTSDAVFLIDNDEGMSVTNDAENVVAYCLKEHGTKRIIYRDTEGRWDELMHDGVSFTGFSPIDETTRQQAP